MRPSQISTRRLRTCGEREDGGPAQLFDADLVTASVPFDSDTAGEAIFPLACRRHPSRGWFTRC